jgi:hypothetical protein
MTAGPQCDECLAIASDNGEVQKLDAWRLFTAGILHQGEAWDAGALMLQEPH